MHSLSPSRCPAVHRPVRTRQSFISSKSICEPVQYVRRVANLSKYADSTTAVADTLDVSSAESGKYDELQAPRPCQQAAASGEHHPVMLGAGPEWLLKLCLQAARCRQLTCKATCAQTLMSLRSVQRSPQSAVVRCWTVAYAASARWSSMLAETVPTISSALAAITPAVLLMAVALVASQRMSAQQYRRTRHCRGVQMVGFVSQQTIVKT